MHEAYECSHFQWSQCIGVSRYGIRSDKPSSEWAAGVNNWELANQGIANPQWYDGLPPPLRSSTLADAVSRMFSPHYFDSWETFASTAWNKPKDINKAMGLQSKCHKQWMTYMPRWELYVRQPLGSTLQLFSNGPSIVTARFVEWKSGAKHEHKPERL